MPAPAAPSSKRHAVSRALMVLLAVALVVAGVMMPAVAFVAAAEVPDHLVVSEVVTGAASASDELVELYNPTTVALPLEGLELVYASSTGATVTRRVAWPAGASLVPAHGHVLVANDLGVFASIADALYSGGMAATGGSVALRIQGATTAIDAVGWGTAASSWMEGSATPAPGAGESIERLPGGADGSTVDSGVNAADFVVRAVPDPQNLASPPTPSSSSPTPTPGQPNPTPAQPSLEPTPVVSPDPTALPTPLPTAVATPEPSTLSMATARAMPDGSIVTVQGVSLTGSDFADGGGYLADASGGIAVLPDTEAFTRGRTLRVTGEIDDRFGQRTLRVAAGGIVDLGPGTDTATLDVGTAAVGEAVEGSLVRIAAAIVGPATTLTGGVAFDVDDGSGPTRLVVGSATGIEVGSWERGTTLELIGVVGQRDSTGTGIAGYRVQPRDTADIAAVGAPATPTPTIGGEPSATPDPSASPEPGVLTIAQARSEPRNARVRVHGTVTLPTGVVDEQTAAIQDGTGAILLRLSEEAGALHLGQRVEVSGTRSTKSGMETIRVTSAPRSLGAAGDPTPLSVATAAAGEDHEARLVVVRGGLVAAARRASSGTVTMEIDDGSGPLRVVAAAPLELDHASLTKGAWVEVRGVLGQETTGAQPLRGYRVWPRSPNDVRVTATATEAGAGDGGSDGGGGGSSGEPGSAVGDLGDLDGSIAGETAVGATLVVGRWPQLGLGGVLWDGERLVGLALADASRVAAALGGRPPPVVLELRGLRRAGTASPLDLPIAAIGTHGDAVLLAGREPAAPATRAPQAGETARWFAVVGRIEGRPSEPRLVTTSGVLPIDRRCGSDEATPRGTVTVSGVALPGRAALIVPCGGIVPGANLRHAAAQTGIAELLVGMSDSSAPASSVSGSSTAPLAAGLLAIGALVLAAVAGWIRWRDVDPPPGSAVDTAPVEEAIDGTPDRSSPSAPVLTLVPLPRERSP